MPGANLRGAPGGTDRPRGDSQGRNRRKQTEAQCVIKAESQATEEKVGFLINSV